MTESVAIFVSRETRQRMKLAKVTENYKTYDGLINDLLDMLSIPTDVTNIKPQFRDISPKPEGRTPFNKYNK